AAVGASTRLVKTLLLGLDGDIGRQEPNQIGAILDQCARTLVQPELVGRERCDARIIDGADFAVRDQYDGHIASAAQPIKTAQHIVPPLVGHYPAFTEAGAFNRGEAVLRTYGR